MPTFIRWDLFSVTEGMLNDRFARAIATHVLLARVSFQCWISAIGSARSDSRLDALSFCVSSSPTIDLRVQQHGTNQVSSAFILLTFRDSCTHMLSPRTRYRPSWTSSTGSSKLNTRSTEPERMMLVVWSNPLSSPCRSQGDQQTSQNDTQRACLRRSLGHPGSLRGLVLAIAADRASASPIRLADPQRTVDVSREGRHSAC